MRRWYNSTLQWKIFYALLLVSLSVIGLTSLFFYYEGVRDSKDQSYALLHSLSKQYSRTVDLFMDDIEEVSLSIFSDPLIQSFLANHREVSAREALTRKNEMYVWLFNYAYPRPELAGISIYTLNGMKYHYEVGAGLNVEYAEAQHWQQELDHISKSKYLLLPSTAISGNEYDHHTVSLVRNIYSIPRRDKLGALKIDIDAIEMGRLLVYSGTDPVGEQLRVFIATDSGEIVYDNADTFTGQLIPSFHAAFADLPPGQPGELEWEGDKYFYTFERSSYTGWNTLILLPYDLIAEIQREAQQVLLLVGSVAVLMAALVSFLIARHITRPLRSLISKMNRVELGDFDSKMETKATGELGVVSRVYNNMLDSIKRLITEVYESRLAENRARLSALQAQINPHFLYNTLNIMKSISRLKGVEEVAEMSESLADLFKYTMKDLQRPVPLQAELEHVNNYMNIQRHRFANRYNYASDVPEILRNASVLKLTIQPLIENAIIHGIAGKRKHVTIRLTAKQHGELLQITVSDDGAGMSKETLLQLQRRLAASRLQQHFDPASHASNSQRDDQPQLPAISSPPTPPSESGIGLLNIHQRIQLLYGTSFGVSVTSKENEGTKVVLTFPYRPYQTTSSTQSGGERQ